MGANFKYLVNCAHCGGSFTVNMPHATTTSFPHSSGGCGKRTKVHSRGGVVIETKKY